MTTQCSDACVLTAGHAGAHVLGEDLYLYQRLFNQLYSALMSGVDGMLRRCQADGFRGQLDAKVEFLTLDAKRCQIVVTMQRRRSIGRALERAQSYPLNPELLTEMFARIDEANAVESPGPTVLDIDCSNQEKS